MHGNFFSQYLADHKRQALKSKAKKTILARIKKALDEEFPDEKSFTENYRHQPPKSRQQFRSDIVFALTAKTNVNERDSEMKMVMSQSAIKHLPCESFLPKQIST